MKILVASPYLPHAAASHGGGRVIYDLIRVLSRRHEVGLVSFVENDVEREHVASVAPWVSELRAIDHDIYHIGKGRRIRNLFDRDPSAIVHMWHPRFAEALRDLTANDRFDIVQLCYPWGASYLDHVRGGVAVMDLIECWGRHWRGRIGREKHGWAWPYFLYDWWRGERLEQRTLPRFRRTFVLTEEDRSWLKARRPELPVVLRRVGVDVVDRPDPQPREGLLFVGSFRHPANREGLDWFLDAVFPRVRARCPGVRLSIAGAPAPRDLEGREGVEVLGFVPDLGERYARSVASISPIRFGGGVKTKGLEAMAHGSALVTTTLGAQGYGAVDGEHLFVADDPGQFADRLVELLETPERVRAMGEAARGLVAEHHSWDAVIGDVEDEYEAVLAEPRA